MEKFIFAFIIGGIICVIGQLIMDTLKITPAHTTCTLVVVGAILGGFGLYDPLVKFAGAGAFVPISSFGNTLVTAAINEAQQTGFLGNSKCRGFICNNIWFLCCYNIQT